MDYQLYFLYGVKIKIKQENNFEDCVMILNSFNNFFIDFIGHKKNMKVLN